MADNTTLGRVYTMDMAAPTPPTPEKGKNTAEQAYNEAAPVVKDKWDEFKQTLTTLKEATGLGVSDSVAAAARSRIADGFGNAILGLATLAGPPPEAVQGAIMSGNQTAIDAVQAAQAAQVQAASGIVDHVRDSVSQAYARNGVAGASAMVLASLGMEVLGTKGTNALLNTASKASEIVRLSKTPAEAAAILTKEAEAAKKAGKSAQEVELLEKAAAERQAMADKDGVAVKQAKMKEHKPTCFKPGEDLKKNWPGDTNSLEKGFYKQLKDQEAGLNKMTVGEYLENRARYEATGRGSEAAQKAMRIGMENDIRKSIFNSLGKTMESTEAVTRAAQSAKDIMASLAALHGPDLKAGGDGSLSRMGNSGINSSLGAQWPGKVGEMDAAAIDAMKTGGPNVQMNVKLERCK